MTDQLPHFPTDPLAFELPAADRIQARRDAAVQAAVGLGNLPQWATWSADLRAEEVA